MDHEMPAEIDEEELVAKLLSRGSSDNQAARPLEKEVIWASLSTLGHNEQGLAVYTTCSLSSLCLSNIDALSAYPFLQKVVLDNNQLTTLQPLQYATSLLSVSAAHNKLDSSVFKHLLASASSLEKLDVSFNQITTLNGIGSFPYLCEVNASNNLIKEVTRGQLENLRSLSKVALNENHITVIDPEAFARSSIRHLNISKNEITDLRYVLPLSGTLATLNASDNNIMHFDGVVNLTLLASLDLSGNNIYDQTELLFLAKVPTLREVGLIGNPLCSLSHGIHDIVDDDAASDVVANDVAAPKRDTPSSQEKARKVIVAAPISKERAAPPVVDQTPEEEDEEEFNRLSLEQQYRLMVLFKAPNVSILDGIVVTPQEITMSKNLKGGADRAHRQEVKTKFLVTASGSAANSLRKARGQ